MFDIRFDGMDALYARDMAAQTQLRFSLSKNHNFQRPDSFQGQMPAMRPFPGGKLQMGDVMNSNSPNNLYQPVSILSRQIRIFSNRAGFLRAIHL